MWTSLYAGLTVEEHALPYTLSTLQMIMKRTVSGSYHLPGAFSRGVLNAALRCTPLVPDSMALMFLRRHRPYQVESEEAVPDSQGLSWTKWKALEIPENLTGKSVLDIGCAEGLFSLESARRGASRVVGVDTRFGALLSAKFRATGYRRFAIDFRVGAFPGLRLRESFDYVLCLSVLHHLVSSKDIWKVLTDTTFATDLARLREGFVELRRRTTPGGRCLIEIPFEYDSEESRRTVDFDRINQELLKAGFSSSRYLGTWSHAARNQSRKDRPIYSAQA